jgi:hypothetical protein
VKRRERSTTHSPRTASRPFLVAADAVFRPRVLARLGASVLQPVVFVPLSSKPHGAQLPVQPHGAVLLPVVGCLVVVQLGFAGVLGPP